MNKTKHYPSVYDPTLDFKVISAVISRKQVADALDAVKDLCRPLLSLGTLNGRLGEYNYVYKCFTAISDLIALLDCCLNGTNYAMHSSDVLDAKKAYPVVLEYLTALNGMNLDVIYSLRDFKSSDRGDMQQSIKKANDALDILTPVLSALWQSRHVK